MQNEDLIKEASKLIQNAYAKYSEFRVAAIVVADDGQIYKGVNVENKSYSLTICAERNAIFSGVTNGMRKISKIVLYSDSENFISPCGACREVLIEFSDEKTEVVMAAKNGEYIVKKAMELLPFGFILN